MDQEQATTVALSTTDKVLGMLEALAQKMGTTGEYLWGVLVKQGYMELYTDITWIVVAAVLAIVCWTKAIKYTFEEVELTEGKDRWGDRIQIKRKPHEEMAILCYIIAITTTIIVLGVSSTIMVPEAYALDTILKALGNVQRNY